MKIRKIRMQNFRCFADKSFTFDVENQNEGNFVVFIGDNGVGKTTILEGIAKSFIPVLKAINPNVANKNYFEDLTISDIRPSSRWAAIETTVDYNNKIYTWHHIQKKNILVDTKEIGELKSPKSIKEAIVKRNVDDENVNIPLVIYYSINRTYVDVPRRRSQVRTALNATEALENAFATTTDFRRFYNWFSNEEENEFRMNRSNKMYKSVQLDAVRNAVSVLLNDYSNLRIEAQPSRMVMDDKLGDEINVMHLSGGYKAVFSLVSDIASRLALANPSLENPLHGEALVLIDELDIHLHPKWQKRIVHDLKRTFPNCQFIATTHSPFVIQSLDMDEVINLEEPQSMADSEGSYRGWSIEEIQEYEMGVETKTSEYAESLQQFEQAIENNETQEAEKLFQAISSMIHPSSPIKKLMKLDMVSLESDGDD